MRPFARTTAILIVLEAAGASSAAAAVDLASICPAVRFLLPETGPVGIKFRPSLALVDLVRPRAECTEAHVKVRPLRIGGFKLRMRWDDCPFYVEAGPVFRYIEEPHPAPLRFVGRVDSACSLLEGQFSAKWYKGESVIVRSFEAPASYCGDGLIDIVRAEECDPVDEMCCLAGCVTNPDCIPHVP